MNLPKRVRLTGTYKCNLKCSFCYNNNLDKSIHEANTHQMKLLISKISDANVKVIRFTGGEFLLRKDAVEIIRYAKAKHLNTGLNTNGTLLNYNMIDKLEGIVDFFLVSIAKDYTSNNVSLQFNTKIKKMFDYIRKKKFNISLSIVLTEKNISMLSRILSLAESTGIKSLLLLRENSVIRSIDSSKILEYELLVENLIRYNEEKGTNYKIKNDIPFCIYRLDRVLKVIPDMNDTGLFSDLTVKPDGTVIPSPSMDIPMGNLLECELMDLWFSDFARRWRDNYFLPQQCKICNYRETCRGGSRIAAFNNSNSMFSLDPLAQPYKYL